VENRFYPIKLMPIRKEKIWGEEIWTLSGLPNNDTIIVNGAFKGISLSELFREYTDHIIGTPLKNKNENFPLLIKFIDCKDDLSVQVHPDDFYARLLENESNGKTECWYILDAEPNSSIIYGHHLPTPDSFLQKILDGQLEKHLNSIQVHKGDFVYVPAGTVHSLGKGIRLLEIQQSSDLTYRIFDWNRLDGKGQKRELHVEKALQVIHFKEPSIKEKDNNNPHTLVEGTPFVTPYFSVELIETKESIQYFTNGQCTILTIIEGDGVIVGNGEFVKCRKGESILLPGCLPSYSIMGKGISILRSSY
jgi:mannose-6-phosphate isomerase